MQKFYRANDTTFVMVENDQVIGFTNSFTVPIQYTPEQVVANCPEFPEAETVYKSVASRTFVESQEGVDFFLDKTTFKMGALLNGNLIDLDSPESKTALLGERKKMKNFLKDVKKAKESYKPGDRVLLYGPTGTGKTYNFLEYLKGAGVAHAIIPVSEGMEDLDLLNYIVPTPAGGVAYKPKEITELLERAEKGEQVCIIFDELNRGSNSLMNLVLKALDPVDGEHYYITNILQDKTYKIKQDNLIWGATVNLGGKYTGTNALDEALLDRFNIINFVGYNDDVEKAIIKAAGFNADQIKKIRSFVQTMRDFASSGEIRSPISTRWVKVWMEEFMNTGDLALSFERTLLYRLVSVDDFGAPNSQEIDIIKGKFLEIIK